MAKRATLSRKRKAASKKAAITRKRRTAGKKAATTRKRRIAGRKAAATKRRTKAVVDTDRAGAERASAAFHQALRTNDLETFMSCVAEDVFFMPPGEPPVRGRDALHKWMTAFLAQYRTSSLTLADREMHIGRGWAVELGTFEWALQPAAGGSAVVDRGNYMQVWKEEGNMTWKFAREVYNSSAPPEAVVAK
jgi:ketosteroid isomerase-like protein